MNQRYNPIRFVTPLLFLWWVGIYLSFPDRMYLAGTDGLMFGAIADGRQEYWQKMIFNTNHFLFNTLAILAHRVLNLLGLAVGGDRAIEIMNGILGATGLTMFFLRLRGHTGDGFSSALGALGMGASFGYWTRASEGQVYMPSLFLLTVLYLTLITYVRNPSRTRATSLAGVAGLAILFHQSNVLTLPALGVAVWLARVDSGERVRDVRRIVVLLGLVVGVPYFLLLVFQGNVGSVMDAWRWLLGSSGVSNTPGQVLPSAFRLGGDSWQRTLRAVEQLVWAPATVPFPRMLSLAFLGGAYGIAVALSRLWAKERAILVATAALTIPYAIFFSMWTPGVVHFWTPHLIWTFALLTFALARAGQSVSEWIGWALRGSVAAGVLALWVANFHGTMGPRSLQWNNASYQRALMIKQYTRQGSAVVISGIGWSEGKTFIPTFAHRAHISLDLALMRDTKTMALQSIQKQIDHGLNNDVPVYLLSEVLEWPSVQRQLQEIWGVTQGELRTIFQPYRLAPVNVLDEQLTLFRVELRHASARTWRLKAEGALREKRWAEAAELFERAVRLEPTVGSLQNLGVCYYHLGQKQRAVKAWERVLVMDPGNAKLRRVLAGLRVQGDPR